MGRLSLGLDGPWIRTIPISPDSFFPSLLGKNKKEKKRYGTTTESSLVVVLETLAATPVAAAPPPPAAVPPHLASVIPRLTPSIPIPQSLRLLLAVVRYSYEFAALLYLLIWPLGMELRSRNGASILAGWAWVVDFFGVLGG